METFIEVTHLTAANRNAIAKKFALKIDRFVRCVGFGPRYYIVVPGRLTGGALVKEVEDAVKAADARA